MSTGPADTGSVYLCIDLKCFYASVECADRGLDPFRTNLVVADSCRGKGTICLAITPAMKALGVRNRCRVFEIPKSVDFIECRPHMRRYMEESAEIYGIYLRYFSPEDIHVYSVDECFIDVTGYLRLYGETPVSMAKKLVAVIRRERHICATAGVGTNLFLAKVALDVLAKHEPDGIGWLDEEAFRRRVWHHRPLTDIWGIGPGTARRLERYGALDLAGVTRVNEELLYGAFGVNAEYLIDHAWGREPCTMADIHAFRPQTHSISNGQVLMQDYPSEQARIVLREMADASCLDLVQKDAACTGVALWVGYSCAGEGPAGASVSRRLGAPTDSRTGLCQLLLALWDEVADPTRSVRRLGVALTGLVPAGVSQPSLFDDGEALAREHELTRATIAVKGRFGKNALVRGTSFRPGSTGRARNEQVGGHLG